MPSASKLINPFEGLKLDAARSRRKATMASKLINPFEGLKRYARPAN